MKEAEVVYKPTEKGHYGWFCKKCGYHFTADTKEAKRYLIKAHKQTLCPMKWAKAFDRRTGKETLVLVRESFEFSLPAVSQQEETLQHAKRD